MNLAKDYYLILEVHPRASVEMIERAKRLLLMRYHPDRNPNDPQSAAAKTRLVLEAFAVLSDPIQRAQYDRARVERASAGRAPGPHSRPTASQRGPGPTKGKPGPPPSAKRAQHAYGATGPRTSSRPSARETPPRASASSKTPTPSAPLPRGVRLVACHACGRTSRIPQNADPTQIRCGACQQPLQIPLSARVRESLIRVDDRLERLKHSLRAFLFRTTPPHERPPAKSSHRRKEKSSR